MQEKITNPEGKIVTYLTHITLENGKTYVLYSDGNLYEEIEGEGFVPLNRLNRENKKVISKLTERLKPAKTDVIESHKKVKKEPVIEIEEL